MAVLSKLSAFTCLITLAFAFPAPVESEATLVPEKRGYTSLAPLQPCKQNPVFDFQGVPFGSSYRTNVEARLVSESQYFCQYILNGLGNSPWWRPRDPSSSASWPDGAMTQIKEVQRGLLSAHRQPVVWRTYISKPQDFSGLETLDDVLDYETCRARLSALSRQIAPLMLDLIPAMDLDLPVADGSEIIIPPTALNLMSVKYDVSVKWGGEPAGFLGGHRAGASGPEPELTISWHPQFEKVVKGSMLFDDYSTWDTPGITTSTPPLTIYNVLEKSNEQTCNRMFPMFGGRRYTPGNPKTDRLGSY